MPLCRAVKINYVPKRPIRSHVEIYLAESAANENEEKKTPLNIEDFKTRPISTTQCKITDEHLHATFDFGFDAPIGIYHKESAHEDMTIAACIGSKGKMRFPRRTNHNNLDCELWEYIRGLVWSDDPSCLLFENTPDSNTVFARGKISLEEFSTDPPSGLTQRSHSKNLQIWHGMAAKQDEDPKTTKLNLLASIEVTYKLATGTQGVAMTDRLDQRFSAGFSESSDPTRDKNLRDLLLGNTTAYQRFNIHKRTPGFYPYIGHNSYAIGHTPRRLRNLRDIDGFIRFKPGTYAQFGPVIAFHTYLNQSDRHKHYDDSKQGRDPIDFESFNHILGARDAIENKQEIDQFYEAKTQWDEDVRDFLADEVFALDPKATHSNSEVDEHFGLPETSNTLSKSKTGVREDEKFQLGLERKMALLESGLASGSYAQLTSARKGSSLCLKRPHLMAITAIICIIVVLTGSFLTLVLIRWQLAVLR